ncbi:PaaX family transcriptional regulator C-terminal domain-containing protein [Shimia sp. Alg240-R146]|uniref:PaaX family transcriptional regulator C-terminal domain-containing protein n=1 Tax=Shimia sp. Alg240-R146 TaxID=2993449 RepID=UPI0022E1EBF9|nr:PaaX family transcriptional regulator C-terminal domain-containing protein [Shimia sp. Alg240-R146]
MEPTELQQIIARVAGVGPIKVWSVVVSVLGDLMQSADDTLGASQLDALVAPMGINNQALRVAVHRLRNDGWVETQRQGRRSRYQLTARGWAETERVRPQIYGAAQPNRKGVFLVVGPPQLAASDFAVQLPKDSAVLTSRSGLVVGRDGVPEDWMCVPHEAAALPDWVEAAVVPETLVQEYDALRAVVKPLLNALVPVDVLERTALRLAILHQWRRLRLRHGDLPDLVLGEDWAGARCRAVVLEALGRLARPELSTLE